MPKRVLLIGGPSTGKTTLLKELQNRGYPCLEEVSREVIKKAQSQGIEQLFVTEPLLFSELLLRARIVQYEEAAHATSKVVFIDRGIPDTVAYMDFINQSYTDEFTQACHFYIYDAVYVLPPWEAIHTTDEERYEDFAHAQKLQLALIDTYKHYGYIPVEVPIGPVEDRAQFLFRPSFTLMQDPLSIAAQYWGFSSFRPLQEEIINSIGIAQIDTIALLPTGGGKSLCFQIPALANEGIAIVVSPLIALMKDQVTGLKEKGIKALAIPSGIPFQELDALLDNCLYGNYKLLYLSPERLQQELVLERIKQMNVSLIAVDEAHCISQWGHDFRPAYREIYKVREIKPDVPIIALTATATPKVIEDISEQLQLRTPKLFQSSYYRANLIYTIQYTTDKNYALEQLLKGIKGSAIVYVRNRKGSVQIAQYLKARGILSTSYHGGMPQDERSKNYIAWRKDSVQVMVGTSAFGMGIDKGNVDIVIHLEIPDSVENYFQEAGRAGRNAQAAKAVLLYNENDLLRLDNQFIKVIPHVSDVKEVYKRLNAYFQVSYGEGAQTSHHFNFSEFCQTYKLPTIRTYNALQVLDRNSVISLSQEFSKRATVFFKVNNMALTYYLVKNPGLDAVVKTILRTYGGIHEQLTAINYSAIANKANCSIAKVHQTLLTLNTDDIIDYEHKSYDTALTFLVPREDDRTINVIASYIKTQANYKEKQVSQVKAFINNKEQCRAISLLGYFDEVLQTPCGSCDVCLNAKPTALKTSDIHTFVLKALSIQELGSKEIINYLKKEYAAVRFRESDILESIKILLSEDKIVITASNTYKLQ